jgi:nucleotidyltransferase substrate binding protein (TIGR01987 family)
MGNELNYSFEKLKEALKKLDDGIKQEKDQLDRDGVIQRFEFTFELLWKTLKLFLADQGILTKSPKETFKETFRYGMFKDENLLLDMLEDRNQTSHIYSEDISKKIFDKVKKKYSNAIRKLAKEISERMDS